MNKNNQKEIITFKVDEAIKSAMNGIENRSDFIRSAILTALNNICPLCHGNGHLTAHQQKHWDDFNKNHPLTECNQCNARHFSCTLSKNEHKDAEKEKA
jgi:hypothetical protein